MNNDTPVQTRNVQQSLILHPDGTLTILGGSDEQTILDENGGHHYQKKDLLDRKSVV